MLWGTLGIKNGILGKGGQAPSAPPARARVYMCWMQTSEDNVAMQVLADFYTTKRETHYSLEGSKRWRLIIFSPIVLGCLKILPTACSLITNVRSSFYVRGIMFYEGFDLHIRHVRNIQRTDSTSNRLFHLFSFLSSSLTEDHTILCLTVIVRISQEYCVFDIHKTESQ